MELESFSPFWEPMQGGWDAVWLQRIPTSPESGTDQASISSKILTSFAAPDTLRSDPPLGRAISLWAPWAWGVPIYGWTSCGSRWVVLESPGLFRWAGMRWCS